VDSACKDSAKQMDLLRVLVTIRRHAYDCWRCLYLWFILQLETFLHPSLHYNTIYQSSTLNSRGIVIKNAIWECGTNARTAQNKWTCFESWLQSEGMRMIVGVACIYGLFYNLKLFYTHLCTTTLFINPAPSIVAVLSSRTRFGNVVPMV